jgi:hypothetical protein
MANDNKTVKTVYNKLADIFSPYHTNKSANATDNNDIEDIESYYINLKKNPEEYVTASNEEELRKKALQMQQSGYFIKQYDEILVSQKNKTTSLESTRLLQYYEFERMEQYPVIGAALDLLSEEATTLNETGKVLTIYSEDKKVKEELERLFYSVLDVGVTLQAWCRNTIKLGDNFVYLLLQENKGIIGARQLTNIEVERVEEEVNDKFVVKYKNRNNNGKTQELADYQVAHFRLLGDDRRMPYGMSVLEKVRKVYMILSMMEDAMLVYRITRAAERRVIKVNTGNIPAEDVPSYMQNVMNKFKKKRLVDNRTGEIDYKYNVATNDEDIFIPVRSDGAANPIDTLPGASNLEAISDVTYFRDLLFTGLGIQKSFLAFSSENGGSKESGQNAAMLDIRLARKINRIQQSMIAELNKIAIIHLALLGGDYRNNLDNFTITMNSPSTQGEMLKIEQFSLKISAYQAATQPDQNTGIRAMSSVLAKKKILGMSEDDIMNDYIEQFLETKMGEELKNAGTLMASSGVFEPLLKYKNAGFNMDQSPTQPGMNQSQGGMGGGFGGGGGMPDLGGGMGGGFGGGGGMPDLGGMGGGMPDLGGGIGGSPSSPDLGQQGLEGQAPEQSPQDELLKENFNKKLKEYTYNGSDIMNEMIKKIENIDKAIN